MTDFFISEQCAIGSALNALGFSIGLSLVFLLLHETPFLQSPQLSALVGRVRFHLPILYIYLFELAIKPIYQIYLPCFLRNDRLDQVSEIPHDNWKKNPVPIIFVILSGKTFFVIVYTFCQKYNFEMCQFNKIVYEAFAAAQFILVSSYFFFTLNLIKILGIQ